MKNKLTTVKEEKMTKTNLLKTLSQRLPEEEEVVKRGVEEGVESKGEKERGDKIGGKEKADKIKIKMERGDRIRIGEKKTSKNKENLRKLMKILKKGLKEEVKEEIENNNEIKDLFKHY